MLFKKIKKDYCPATCSNVQIGDIVKFSKGSKTSTGYLYFINDIHGSILILKNMTTMNIARYDLNSNKFLF